MVFPGFNEASGTSTRSYPHEPTASKPCRPRGGSDPILSTATAKKGRGPNRIRGPFASSPALLGGADGSGGVPCAPWSSLFVRGSAPRLGADATGPRTPAASGNPHEITANCEEIAKGRAALPQSASPPCRS